MKYVWPVDLVKPFKFCNVVNDSYLNSMNAEEKYIVSRTENLLTFLTPLLIFIPHKTPVPASDRTKY
jgi:hypothetical protein